MFDDFRYLIFYAMHTQDGRIAIGGRGAPYHSLPRERAVRARPAVRDHLRELLAELFPVMSDFKVTHHWGGAIAAPRDWYSSAGLDRATGMAWAGGYIGDGVSATNLAGRAFATSSPAGPRPSRICPGWATARRNGSRSRSAGSASTRRSSP